LLSERIAKLCKFTNESGDTFIHPIVKAIIIHFWLAYEHPFCDGNGRTARALFYWFLLKYDYRIIKYISISKLIVATGKRYYKTFLDSETDNNDLNYFVKFQMEILKRSVETFTRYVKKKQDETLISMQNYALLGKLNSRQRNVALKILRHKNEYLEFTLEAHMNLNGITLETARRDMNHLFKLKLFNRHKNGNKHIFTPSKNFEQILAR
jgi:Uncharacterized conserved protein